MIFGRADVVLFRIDMGSEFLVLCGLCGDFDFSGWCKFVSVSGFGKGGYKIYPMYACVIGKLPLGVYQPFVLIRNLGCLWVVGDLLVFCTIYVFA